MRDSLAYEKKTIKRLFVFGVLLWWLPIAIGFVIGWSGWIAYDPDIFDLIIWGIFLPIAVIGISLFTVGLYMAKKNLEERD